MQCFFDRHYRDLQRISKDRRWIWLSYFAGFDLLRLATESRRRAAARTLTSSMFHPGLRGAAWLRVDEHFAVLKSLTCRLCAHQVDQICINLSTRWITTTYWRPLSTHRPQPSSFHQVLPMFSIPRPTWPLASAQDGLKELLENFLNILLVN